MEERKKKCSDKMPLRDFPVAMAYVPWQEWEDVYELCEGPRSKISFLIG